MTYQPAPITQLDIGPFRVRVERRPPPARVTRRWNGAPQAQPATFAAILVRSTATTIAGFTAFAAALNGEPWPPAPRRRPAHLRRHL